MEGPPRDTGTPRGRRAAVLSRQGMDGGTSEGRSGARCFPCRTWMEGPPKCTKTPRGHGEPQKAREPPSPKALLGPLPPPSPQRSPAGSPSPPLLRPDRHFSNSAVPGPPPAPSRGGGPGEPPAGGPGERRRDKEREPPFPTRPRGSRRSGPRLRRCRRRRPPRGETRGRGAVRRREGARTPRTRRYRTPPAGEGEAGERLAGSVPAVALRRLRFVPKGGDGRHSGGCPLRPSGSAEQKDPRVAPAGPLVLGPSGGSQFQFSTWARSKGNQRSAALLATGSLHPIPGTGRCWALGKFSPAGLLLHTQFLLNI